MNTLSVIIELSSSNLTEADAEPSTRPSSGSPGNEREEELYEVWIKTMMGKSVETDEPSSWELLKSRPTVVELHGTVLGPLRVREQLCGLIFL